MRSAARPLCRLRNLAVRSLAALLAIVLLTSTVAAVEVVCHRGANEYAPENTYASSQMCIDWGVAYVEIDVRTSRDGVMYVIHDATVDRTTNGSGKVAELTSDEIDRLDAGSWFDPKFADQRIPRLDEYLRWIKGQAKVYFDVKAADLERLIALVYETGLEDDCFFWFGNPLSALEFRRLDQRLALKVNVSQPDDVGRAVERYRANIVEVGLNNVSTELVEACRAHGVKLMIYHPQKDAAAFREVIRWQADMINLNHGDLFLEVQRQVAAGE